VDRAEMLHVLDVGAVEAVLARAPGRHGARPLGAVLARFDGERARTRSELERRFLRICDRAGITRPRVNHVVWIDGDPVEVDFAWPDRRLAVETDGHATHGTRHAFEADRRRDQRMRRAGWDTMRFTWRQVTHRPREVESTLVAVVDARAKPSLQDRKSVV
jgi:very-short-patch-repair endonuclease